MKQMADYADLLIITPFYLGYLWAADRFCKKYLGASKKKEVLFLFLSFVSHLFWDAVNGRCPVPSAFCVMLDHLFFMGLIVLLFHSDRERKILAGSMLITAMLLVGNFWISFLSCLALFFKHTVRKIPEPFLDDWEGGAIGGAGFCLIMLAVVWMSEHLGTFFVDKPKKWYVILALPLLMAAGVISVASWGASNGIMVSSGGSMGLYYDQIFSHAEFLILAVLCMAATGFYVFGMERIYLEREKSNRYHSQIAAYKMLEEEYGQSERLRHDMKNHIIVLSGLFHGKEWEKMGEYLKNMESGVSESCGDATGNRAVDALLYQKRKQAETGNIKWECDIQISGVCGINDFDLCILFGNLLDNALEACERLRLNKPHYSGGDFINIQAKTVKRFFLLEVKNSMDTTETYTAGTTKKGNPKEHGIGLLNVSDVVHKYDGVMNIEAGKGVFMISILIPLNGGAFNRSISGMEG